ncbi:hypothetical protein [Geoglobus acetivorans]|uniref:Uncharacterized protein n=1 Tax=Geoglobus acetivorans TaxID=565033 RepID=A0A0A7GHE4_GEOAI|nr:hypothetical protein GACE_1275 [Geoglobus acetivorans]
MELSIFHAEELEDVLNSIPDLKPSFRKLGNVEVIAENKEVRVGKYRNYVIVLSSGELEFENAPIETFRIVLRELENGRDFQFGTYRFEENTVEIQPEREMDFLELSPIFSELAALKTLSIDAGNRGEFLSKEETKIIDRTVRILENAGTMDISVLEDLAFELSSLKGKFISRYMKFKDEIEEIGQSLIRFKSLSRKYGHFLYELTPEYEDVLSNLRYYEMSFDQTLRSVRDSLETIHLKLESIQRRETLELQKRTSALQVAAAVIEFIVVFYYTMGIWSKYADLSMLPKWLSLLTLTVLSATVPLLTEAFGEYLLERRVGRKLVVYLMLISLCIAIILYTIFF